MTRIKYERSGTVFPSQPGDPDSREVRRANGCQPTRTGVSDFAWACV